MLGENGETEQVGRQDGPGSDSDEEEDDNHKTQRRLTVGKLWKSVHHVHEIFSDTLVCQVSTTFHFACHLLHLDLTSVATLHTKDTQAVSIIFGEANAWAQLGRDHLFCHLTRILKEFYKETEHPDRDNPVLHTLGQMTELMQEQDQAFTAFHEQLARAQDRAIPPFSALGRVKRSETNMQRQKRLDEFFNASKAPHTLSLLPLPRAGQGTDPPLLDIDEIDLEDDEEDSQSDDSMFITSVSPTVAPCNSQLAVTQNQKNFSKQAPWTYPRNTTLSALSIPRGLIGSPRRAALGANKMLQDAAFAILPPLPSPRIKAASGSPRVKAAGAADPNRNPARLDVRMVWERARNLYLKECNMRRTRPLILPFTTGHSSALISSRAPLSDEDMFPLTAMVEEVPWLTEVDLKGNSSLSGRSIIPFLQTLHRKTRRTTAHVPRSLSNPQLVVLDLSGCLRLGPDIADVLTDVLSDKNLAGLVHLRKLGLSQVCLSAQSCLPLAACLGKHPRLEEVYLAGAGFDSSRLGLTASLCLAEVLSSKSIKVLDLCWNKFSEEVFLSLGERLCMTSRLTKLLLAGCAGSASSACYRPIDAFLETLAKNNGLEHLDISLNHMDHRSGLILEDALENHKSLTDLVVSGNPLGSHGMRALVRLLSYEHSPLRSLTAQMDGDGCTSCEVKLSEDVDGHIFSYIAPAGRYDLDLTAPFHRSFLRMLLKNCDHFGLSPVSSFSDTIYSLGSYPAPVKKNGFWEVARTGNLQTSFTPIRGSDLVLSDIRDVWDFKEFQHKMLDRRRIRLRLGYKAEPVFIFWRSANGNFRMQLALLDAFSKDFSLSYVQVRELCVQRYVPVFRVLEHTLHSVEGGQSFRSLSMLLLPGMPSFIRLFDSLRQRFYFNVESPTWRYSLHLSNPSDYCVANILFLLNRWEVSIEERLKIEDTSEFGDRSHIRNIVFMGQPLLIQSIFDWVLPDSGLVKFDYVTAKRPFRSTGPPDECTLSTDKFSQFLTYLQRDGLENESKLNVLRRIVSYLYVTSKQLRELMGLWKLEWRRADCVLLFFFRVVDMHNEKVFRCMFAQEEVHGLRKRLGYITWFPFIQPGFSTFRLDLSKNDQRLAVSILVSLCQKENARLTSLIGEGGIDLSKGISPTWADVRNVAKTGILQAKYTCSPKERKFSYRKQIFEKYGHWKLAVKEEEVLWWSNLREAEEVADFVVRLWVSRKSFEQELIKEPTIARLVPHGVDPGETDDDSYTSRLFKYLGHSGESLTLTVFQKSINVLNGEHAFKELGNPKYVEGVFRYLDTDGHGTVFESQWNILAQLWQEVMLTVHEFVKCIARTYDFRPTCLDEAWKALDRNDSGTISASEFKAGVVMIQFLGASNVVFRYLQMCSKPDQNAPRKVNRSSFLELRLTLYSLLM